MLPKFRPYLNKLSQPLCNEDGGRAPNRSGEWCGAVRPYFGICLLLGAVVLTTSCAPARAADGHSGTDGAVSHTPPASSVLPDLMPVSRIPIRKQAGICFTADRLAELDFSSSRFPMPDDSPGVVDVDPPLPANYDRLLSWCKKHYDPGVDASEVLWNLRRAVADSPLLAPDLTEHVTRQACIIWKESGGRHWAEGDKDWRGKAHSLGCLQLNDSHIRRMNKCGLSFEIEMHRVRCAQQLVSERYAAGHRGWACYSDWSVTKNNKAAEVKAAYALLMEEGNDSTN